MRDVLGYATRRFVRFSVIAWILTVAAFVVAGLLSRPALPRYVGAEPVQYSQEIQDWIRGLKSEQQRSPCCDLADGDFTQQDIRLGADGNSHFFVNIEGQWVEVPDASIVREPNRIGRPIVWFSRWPGLDGKPVTFVRCFLAGALF